MKFEQLHALKEAVMAHKKEYTQKEYKQELEYKENKRLILAKIQGIEDLKIKQEQFRRDIEEYLKSLKTRLKIDFLVMIGAVPKEQPEKKEEGKEGSLIPPV